MLKFINNDKNICNNKIFVIHLSEQNKINMKYYKIRDVIDSDDSIREKAVDIFLMLLKPSQREIFEHIPRGSLNAVSAKEIKEKTGIPTKNISTQMKNLSVNFPIGIVEQENGYKKYFRKE